MYSRGTERVLARNLRQMNHGSTIQKANDEVRCNMEIRSHRTCQRTLPRACVCVCMLVHMQAFQQDFMNYVKLHVSFRSAFDRHGQTQPRHLGYRHNTTYTNASIIWLASHFDERWGYAEALINAWGLARIPKQPTSRIADVYFWMILNKEN